MAWTRTFAAAGTARLLDPAGLRLEGIISNVLLAQPDPFAARTGLIATSSGQLVRLYSDRNGAPVSDPFDCGRFVDQVSIDGDGRRLAAVTYEAKLMGFALRESDKGAGSTAVAPGFGYVAFCMDGRHMLVETTNRSVELRETLTGNLSSEIMPGESNVTAMALSGDHKWLAVGTSAGQMQVWDVEGRRLARPPFTFKTPPANVRFSADGRQLTFVVGNALHLCEWQSDLPNLGPLPLEPGVNPPFHWIEFSPEGHPLVAACQCNAQMWDIASRRSLFALVHNAPVFRARFSRDGEGVITAGADGTARLWDAYTGRQHGPALPHAPAVCEALLTAESQKAITASPCGTARVWEAATGRRLAECADQGDEVLAAAVSPGGSLFATMTHGGRIRVWDTRTALPVAEERLGRWGRTTMRFLPDDRTLVFYDGQTGVQRIEPKSWPLPCPDWVPELALGATGYRYIPPGLAEPVPVADFLRLRSRILAVPQSDPYAQWARRFFAEPAAASSNETK